MRIFARYGVTHGIQERDGPGLKVAVTVLYRERRRLLGASGIRLVDKGPAQVSDWTGPFRVLLRLLSEARCELPSQLQ